MEPLSLCIPTIPILSPCFTRYGYHSLVFGRPDLFKMLESHVPQGKILMGKRVLSTSQTEEGVLVRCSDGSTYHGDVLVGADGAYSSVRQCMHKSLKEKGILPKSDSEKLKFDQHCVVGITDELSPEKFPILKEDPCELFGVIGKKRPYTVRLSTLQLSINSTAQNASFQANGVAKGE